MVGAELKEAREVLGRLWGLNRPVTMAELGRALRLPGRDPGRYIGRYEHGRHPIPHGIEVAVEMLVGGCRPPDEMKDILRKKKT